MSLEAPDPSKADEPISDGYAWYVVGVLMVVYLFSFLDRQILSLMVDDLKVGLSLERDWEVAFLMGPAFAIFYTIFGIPFGRAADTRSRKHVIALGLGIWSLMTVGCGLTRSFWQMALLRVGVGIGEASLSPSAYSIIADSFDGRKLARAMSLYASGIYLGSGLAYLIGGQVVAAVDVGHVKRLVVLKISISPLVPLLSGHGPARRGRQHRLQRLREP